MAELNVKQLADVVDVPVERLLQQMKAAGLEHSAESDNVSEDEKQALLGHLKRSHGDSEEAAAQPRRITLSRKTTSTLKAGSSRKTVNVEVRKKRTYVKRDEMSPEERAAEDAATQAEESARERADAEVAASRQAVETARLQAETDKQKATEEAVRAAAEAQLKAEQGSKANAKAAPVKKTAPANKKD
ncbi:MAG: IF-2-associated domain-containing protein, partial [Halopseudomonas sp.]